MYHLDSRSASRAAVSIPNPSCPFAPPNSSREFAESAHSVTDYCASPSICAADHPKSKPTAERESIPLNLPRASPVSACCTSTSTPLSIQVLRTHQCGAGFQAEPTVSTCRFLYRGEWSLVHTKQHYGVGIWVRSRVWRGLPCCLELVP